ncbi:MAG TPA: alanine dehydrogenase [Vicinamibacteria bacterium]|nr:alanine dehydrogenase [Vicinamibacteria bacterium]
MKIGTVKELKDNEFRVGLVPGGVRALTESGHDVIVEQGAGLGSGITDDEYLSAGAKIVPSAQDVFAAAEMVVKVKEPLEQEVTFLRAGQILFTYLHLAPMSALTESLLERGVTGIAYETITAEDGSLPLLTPMSEVAGRMAIQEGAHYLEKAEGGLGMLVGGVPGVPRGEVIIIGGGVVGLNAAKMAVGLGGNVTILDKSLSRMQYLDDIFGGRVTTLMSNPITIEESVRRADLVVGAVLIPGASAPKLVTRAMIREMKNGAVIVDVAVDQGGCFETTRPTTHSNPTYFVDGVVHYCVANMPGAVPRTSTFALTNVTLPYALQIANRGFIEAVRSDTSLYAGVNTYDGQVTCAAVALSQRRAHTPLEKLL